MRSISRQYKLLNRRVTVIRWEDDTYEIRCKKLGNARREIVKTNVRYSSEAMDCILDSVLYFMRVPLPPPASTN